MLPARPVGLEAPTYSIYNPTFDSYRLMCPNCNAAVSATAKFCSECGHALTALPPEPAPVTSGGRRHLTVMYCDIVNSIRVSEEIDPEELRDYLREYQETCASVIRRFDGHVAKYLGDGLLVHFGYPTAHEDDAQRAVRAGLGMLEALHRSDFQGPRGQSMPVEIRIGIDTGLVVIDQILGSRSHRTASEPAMEIFGETPNIASYLQSIAEPDALLISANTHRLIEGYFEMEYQGPQTVRGISAPIGVYRVLHESTARSRLEASAHAGLTRMVGRANEIGELRARWEEARFGHGHTVYVSGEAGIGKSRISLAMKEYVAHETVQESSSAWLVEIQCSPYYQNTAFYPVAQLIEHTVLAFSLSDSVETKYAKLEGYLAQNGLDLEENVPLFVPLLSLTPNPRYRPLDTHSTHNKQRTMALLEGLLLRRAAEQPVLFIAEDLHWADPSTLEVLGRVIPKVPSSHLLAILTFRPEFEAPWGTTDDVTELALSRLGSAETRAIVENILSEKHIPDELAAQILDKTDGIPLYIEEITKNVLEGGAIVEVSGHYELSGTLEDFALPDTLQDSLMARLDRLSTSKAIAQLAASLGREFSYELLKAVAPVSEAVLRHELAQLVGAELLFQHGTPPDARYTFKHALIQDAAYQSLLKSTRQGYHAKIASVLSEKFPEVAANQPELLAHHYTEAKNLPAAVAEWLKAGRQAVTRSANKEAVNHYRRGLDVLAELPADSPVRATELPLQLALGAALISTAGYSSPAVQTVFARASVLCQALGASPELARVLWGLWGYNMVRGKLQTAYDFAEELTALADQLDSLDLKIEAASCKAASSFWFAKYEECVALVDWIEDVYTLEQHGKHAFQYTQDPKSSSLSFKAWSLWLLGYPEQARATAERNIAHSRTVHHAYSLGFGLIFSAMLFMMMEDEERVVPLEDESWPLSESNGYPIWMAGHYFLQGWLMVRHGEAREALPQYEQGLAIWDAVGGCLWLTGPMCFMLQAAIACGEFERGWEIVRKIRRIQSENGELFYQPETLRVEGELILAEARERAATGGTTDETIPHLSPKARAEALFRESLALAAQFHSKTFTLKTAISLHTLLGSGARSVESREILERAYQTFTEGFDAPLLVRAKKMLDEVPLVKSLPLNNA